jgi:phenylacetate-CoA ligase
MATLLPDAPGRSLNDESWVPKWLPGPRGVNHVGNVAASAEEQVDWLKQIGPAVLRTRPALLRRLLSAVATNPLLRPSLNAIVTQGETVTEDDRQRCRDVLGLEIIDAYDRPEAGIVAIQCPVAGTYHIQSEVCLVEVLDRDGRPCGPGGVGEITITPIYAFAMPLVRYATGETAQLLSGDRDPQALCACGRGLPSFRRVVVRRAN